MPSKRRRARRDRENTGGPSPAWIGSAVLLGLVAVALVIVLIHAATSPKPATPAAASPPGATPGAGPSAGVATAPGGAPAPTNAGQEGRPAGCSTTGSDQTIPTSPPSGVTWSLSAGFAVPSSVADGPTLHGPAGIGYCYSHTPLGALLAASNLGRGTGTPQQVQDAVLNLSVVPNEYSAQVAKTPATPDDQSGAGIQFAGFRIISYSPDQASITLATRVPGRTDTYPQLTVAMQWYAGDWRAVPQAGPALFVAVASAPSLAGFVPWAGVS
jgi:hypothetical protein